MKKEISWNNKRRSISYWLAIEFLLCEALNMDWWIGSDDTITAGLRKLIKVVYGWLIPNDPYHLFSLMLGWFTVHSFAIGAIALMNGRLSSLHDKKKDERLFQFTSKSVFTGDVILGIFLEVTALNGLITMTDTFHLTSFPFLLFLGFLILGSYLYWNQVFPYRQYRKAVNLLRHTDYYEDTAWFCLSNSENICSTFQRVPRKGKLKELIVENDDLPHLAVNRDGLIQRHEFCLYLIAIDFRQDLTGAFMEEMQNIVNLPHATVLVCMFGSAEAYAVSEQVTALLSDCQNVYIQHFENQALTEAVDIEAILETSRLRKPRKIRAPFRIVKDAQLLQVYLNTGYGPKLCLDFMKLILNKLDVLPGVYALFDLIDLEYRIAVAYDRNYSRQKLRRKADAFGHINAMAKMIENSVLVENDRTGRGHISAEQIFNSIISDRELALIRKYLPNYQIRLHEPGYNTIVYLASSLRNVLRGHGYFDHADANQLFELIFKIALMNACILTISDISLHITTIEEWQDKGYYKVNGRKEDGEDKQLSPFFVGTEQGSILVFNNWNRATEHSGEAIEYINYLDGTLILPEFTNVALDK